MYFLLLCVLWILCGMVQMSTHGYHITDRNLALGKPTTQNGTADYQMLGFEHEGKSEYAVDGNFKLDAENMTCTLTNANMDSWWMVDLLDWYLVTHIVILPLAFNQFRTRFIRVEVSNYWDDVTKALIRPSLCVWREEKLPFGERTTCPCNSPVMGRYVRITKQLHLPSKLSLCQVEVYADRPVRYFELKVAVGQRSRDRLLETIPTSHAVHCMAKCKRHLDCTGFNLAAKAGVCELVSRPPTDSDPQEEEGAEGWTRYTLR